MTMTGKTKQAAAATPPALSGQMPAGRSCTDVRSTRNPGQRRRIPFLFCNATGTNRSAAGGGGCLQET